MPKQKTQLEWLESVPKSHRDKFDYSKAVYTKSQNKVILICRTCKTEFQQRADMQVMGVGCKVCQHRELHSSLIHSQEKFIEDSKAAFGDMYDFSLVQYKNKNEPVSIICKKNGHGVFQVRPVNLQKGRLHCSQCIGDAISDAKLKSQDQFLQECLKLDTTNVTFERVKYRGSKRCVTFTCTVHGPFEMTPRNFLIGCRCPSCANYGYRQTIPGRFYILSDGYTTKVGITNKSPETRAMSVFKTGGPELQVISSFYFSDGSIPPKIERASLKYLKSRYARPESKFDGSTECFLQVSVSDLLTFVTSFSATQESE